MIFLLAFLTSAYPQDPMLCPDGYTCLKDEQYAAIYAKLEELEVIEEGEPKVEFTESIIILTDDDGRVFTNSTGGSMDKLIPGTVEWGHVSADLALKVDVEVHRAEPPNGGLRLRPKLLTSYLVLRTDLTDPMQAVDFGLDLDFLYWRKWNLSAYVGARSVGTDAGFDVFAHSGVAVGGHWAYPDGTSPFSFSPTAGWYFAF